MKTTAFVGIVALTCASAFTPLSSSASSTVSHVKAGVLVLDACDVGSTICSIWCSFCDPHSVDQ